MKILYLITKSTIGGAQTHISQLSSSLLSDGETVSVSAQPGGWLEDEISKSNAQFYPNEYMINSYNPTNLFKAIKRTKKIIKEFEPDIVSCHSSFAGLVGRIAAKNYGTKVLFTAHGWGFSQGAPLFRRSLLTFTEKFAAKYTDKIVCVSDYDKQLAINNNIAPKEKLTTIHNGTEIPEIDFDQFPIKDKVNIVFVGRLADQKDPILLLQAIDELDKEIKNKINLKIIGDGPNRNQVEKFITKNNLKSTVKITGDIPRKKVFEHLQNSHIFTLISNWEGFPRSILEAMSCGLTIIATDVAGVSESVTEDCGVLVEKGNKEDIKQALTKLISNPKIIEEKGQYSRQRVKANFSIDQTIKTTKKLYRKLLNQD